MSEKMDEVKLAIVVSEFNYDITRVMLEKAVSHARFLGASVEAVYKVPGTFDSPFAVAEILKNMKVDAVAVLGAVVKGETEHDEVVAHQAARKILDLGIQYGVPVTLGIIGPGASRDEAIERAEEYAARAVEAAVKMARRAKSFRSKASSGERGFTVE
ncbi:MAG: 6,7-dimethyl-8-ribityllumazine synthase [Desulfurococcales archaeon]|nr:6,7-dimethyl-8-ribityllumazine synthase [Desulfurococcales archaeon]